jgi:hypothetical protein
MSNASKSTATLVDPEVSRRTGLQSISVDDLSPDFFFPPHHIISSWDPYTNHDAVFVVQRKAEFSSTPSVFDRRWLMKEHILAAWTTLFDKTQSMVEIDNTIASSFVCFLRTNVLLKVRCDGREFFVGLHVNDMDCIRYCHFPPTLTHPVYGGRVWVSLSAQAIMRGFSLPTTWLDPNEMDPEYLDLIAPEKRNQSCRWILEQFDTKGCIPTNEHPPRDAVRHMVQGTVVYTMETAFLGLGNVVHRHRRSIPLFMWLDEGGRRRCAIHVTYRGILNGFNPKKPWSVVLQEATDQLRGKLAK